MCCPMNTWRHFKKYLFWKLSANGCLLKIILATGFNSFMHNVAKWPKHTLKILWCSHRKILKVFQPFYNIVHKKINISVALFVRYAFLVMLLVLTTFWKKKCLILPKISYHQILFFLLSSTTVTLLTFIRFWKSFGEFLSEKLYCQ